MKDLSPKGYVMKNRLKGLDREHLFMLLKKLAQVHAASAVLYEKNDQIYKTLNFGLYNREIDVFYPYFYNFWDALCNAVSSWPGYESYAIKLKAMRSELIENGCKAYDKEDGDFHVFTHGDLWMNNIMFNYDSKGGLSNLVLVST